MSTNLSTPSTSVTSASAVLSQQRLKEELTNKMLEINHLVPPTILSGASLDEQMAIDTSRIR
jgi:hypothetical protein